MMVIPLVEMVALALAYVKMDGLVLLLGLLAPVRTLGRGVRG
jgi:hypothetical protein